jgi:hypothetical protein
MSGIPHPINVKISIVTINKGIAKLYYLHNIVKHILSVLDSYIHGHIINGCKILVKTM